MSISFESTLSMTPYGLNSIPMTSANNIKADTFQAIQKFGDCNGQALSSLDPLLVKIIFEGNYCVVENEEYNVYASGSSASVAIDEFKVHIKNHYLHYQASDPAKLDLRANKIRTLFSQNFRVA